MFYSATHNQAFLSNIWHMLNAWHCVIITHDTQINPSHSLGEVYTAPEAFII